MLNFHGLEKCSFIDYPGKIVMTVFFGGCISGGEPLLADAGSLIAFIREVKAIPRTGGPFLVKLDTNGSKPEALRSVLPILDFVSMDIKTSPGKYSMVTGKVVDVDTIRESVQLLVTSNVDYEFRTTMVPDVVTLEDLDEIGRMVSGAKKYVINEFIPRFALESSFKIKSPYPDWVFEESRLIIASYVHTVRVNFGH